jgi:lipid II:glycine glycyltransferase (peptidoglycan interpeptide bridge formation enzyme)
MYGVSGNNRNDGSAQLLQWEVIQHLKKAGQHWYDFGGVPEVNEMNGIYRFKKSFGGEAVDLGAEYSYSSFFLQVVKFLYKKIRLLP